MGVKLKLLHHEELSCCRPFGRCCRRCARIQIRRLRLWSWIWLWRLWLRRIQSYYGKRSADADAEPGYYGYGGYGLGYGYGGYGLGYRGYGYRGYYGKRSADAEADAEPGYYG